MSLEQAIVTILVALIGAAGGARGGIIVERMRRRREIESETNLSAAEIAKARLSDEAIKRKEIDDAARDIREFLRKQVAELNEALDKIEVARACEREKWHAMLTDSATKNLELELQHRRDMARIQELEEEARVIDDEIKNLRTRIATCQGDAVVMSAQLDQCQRECERLRLKMTQP